MQKKGLIFILVLFLINFVSAQFFSGYNRFSFRGFLDSVDPTTMILITLFSLVFLLLTLIFKRIPLFRDSYGSPNRAMIGIASAIISLFTIWEVNRSGLGIENFFYSIGLSSDLLYVILPIIILIAIIFIIWRFSFAAAFLIFGLLLILLTLFTDIFYEKGITFIIGLALFLIGLWLWRRRRRRNRGQGGGSGGTRSLWPGRRGPRGPPRAVGPTRPAGGIGPAGTTGGPPGAGSGGRPQPTVQQIGKDKNRLARKLGINKLQKEHDRLSQELQEGFQKAGDLSSQATSLGWTKSGRTNPRQGETDSRYKSRVKEANKTYKEWYRQYSKNIQNEKRLKEIQARMQHLQIKI